MNIISLLIPKETAAYLYDDCTLRQGLEKMKAHGYTAIPVLTQDGMYAGTVSEGDFLWNLLDASRQAVVSAKTEALHISDILRKDFNPSVNIYISMEELLWRSVSQSFIPVTDDRGYFIGIVTRQKILRTLLASQETEKTEK